MRTAESPFLGPLGGQGTFAILVLLLRQYYRKRDVLWANWTYMWVLATFRMGESPLKLTCINACTPGFHSTELKLQKQGLSVMLILVAKFGKAGLKRFQVTGSLVFAHA